MAAANFDQFSLLVGPESATGRAGEVVDDAATSIAAERNEFTIVVAAGCDERRLSAALKRCGCAIYLEHSLYFDVQICSYT